MSQTTSSKVTQKSAAANDKVASSIVHKPFETGKINIFHPHKTKPNGEIMASKLVLNATLEDSDSSEPVLAASQSPNRLNLLLNPWTISAIAILLLANIVSGLLIWRNSLQVSSNVALETNKTPVGNYDLTAQEFIPLNLNTLSTLPSSSPIVTNNLPESTKIEVEIPPALLPLNINNSSNSFDTKYHYILTEYQGDRSLKSVKQKVDSVSLVHFPQGVFIYMGAFTQKTAAIEFISQLEAAGIKAYIYPFQN